MTVIARRVRAIPVRSSRDTWACIVDIVARDDLDMREDLERAADVAAMLIAEEHTTSAPMILSGCEPQVRVYTVHGQAAIDDFNTNENPAPINPTDDWEMSLPASGVDLALAEAAVEAFAHIVVRDHDNDSEPTSASQRRESGQIFVDLSVLGD